MTAEEQQPMADRRRHLIFISYRGSDQNWATELIYARMTEAFGTDTVFKAGNALRAGADFPPILRREAASCPVMLACIGPDWLTVTAPDGGRRLDSPGDWVREEIATALQAGNHVVPLLIGNRNEVAIPKADQVPEPIRDMVLRQAVWLAPGRGLDTAIPKLVDRLAELVPELAQRRRLSVTQPASTPQAERRDDRSAPAVPGTVKTQRNEVAGDGLLIGTQDGSIYVDAGAAAQAPAGDGGDARAVRRSGMPLEGELTTLVEAAAVALVTAMGTNAWTSVRDTAGRVFRRGGTKGHDKIGDRLDDDASLVAAAHDQAGERAALEPFWRLKLTELVKAVPECAPDLAEIIWLRDEAARPAAAGTHLEQHTTVRDSGRAFVAQGGNVIMHGELAARPSSGATGHPGVPDDGQPGPGRVGPV
jgi:hypothetical protein